MPASRGGTRWSDRQDRASSADFVARLIAAEDRVLRKERRRAASLERATAESIADDMEAWYWAGAADGFVIQVTHHPGPLDQFIDEVVPFLVQRKLFRAEYDRGTL